MGRVGSERLERDNKYDSAMKVKVLDAPPSCARLLTWRLGRSSRGDQRSDGQEAG